MGLHREIQTGAEVAEGVDMTIDEAVTIEVTTEVVMEDEVGMTIEEAVMMIDEAVEMITEGEAGVHHDAIIIGKKYEFRFESPTEFPIRIKINLICATSRT